MRRTIILSVFISIALLVVALMPRKIDSATHLELLRVSRVKEPSPTKQSHTHILKTGVIKEGWIGERHMRITAPKSELYLLADEKDAIEELEDVKATLSKAATTRLSSRSEKSESENTLNVRTFEGEKARFYYKTRSLYGTKVHFSDYTLHKDESLDSLQEKNPEISGIAERIAFALKENNIDVHVYGIVADFNKKFLNPKNDENSQ